MRPPSTGMSRSAAAVGSFTKCSEAGPGSFCPSFSTGKISQFDFER